ncbi:hypothetical protein ANRL4_03516 [Anaerolineae bacterium]|nr:hypothetical protein ANRL4_03516 [Anaerolineae bacterium]
MLAACSGGGAATVATSNNPSASNQPSAKSEVSQPAASGGALSAQGIDACKAITADDVKRISTYDGAKFEGKEGYCEIIAGDGKLNIGVNLGMDTGVDMSGNERIDLGNGIKGSTTGSGWLNQLTFPDSSTINLIISGSALHGEDTTKLKFTKGDGTGVDAPSVYQAYAQAVLANVGKAK